VELQSTLRKERERLVLAEEKYHKTRARMQTLQAGCPLGVRLKLLWSYPFFKG
jgi:hypothetical protein